MIISLIKLNLMMETKFLLICFRFSQFYYFLILLSPLQLINFNFILFIEKFIIHFNVIRLDFIVIRFHLLADFYGC